VTKKGGAMKAITIWQPWASLIAIGAKQYETRSWATSYRGQIAIHAAKKDIYKIMGDLPFDVVSGVFKAFYEAYKIEGQAQKLMEEAQGYIIATAELVNCHRITNRLSFRENEKTISIQEMSEQELLFGDWTPGRYAWELANVKILDKPVPAKGQQRLWTWEGQRNEQL
jgi:hypothetical protein